MRALLIPVDAPAHVIEGTFDLDTLYRVLDCEMVQAVPLRGNLPGNVWLDEEGKLGGNCLVNHSATHMAYIMRGDSIVGHALVLGPYDDEGENTDVPDEVLDAFENAGISVNREAVPA